mgnify:CR=1 FL=1
MGLIAAALNAAGGTLASQWKEYFYVDALPDNVLATKAEKKVKGRFGGSRHEDDNVISDGSVIAVADGQCMMIVDQGKIMDFCAEPGEYVFQQNGEPSIFYGALNGEKAKAILKTTFDRLSFGGQAGKDQRVYFFNTKEILGNKYGTPSPVPFRVVDNNIGLDVDISIRCFGEYSYRVTNPMLFYTNVCGNVTEDYPRSTLDSQLKTELLTALQPAFAKISELGIRYSALPGHAMELADTLNQILSAKWRELRGVEIVSCGVSSVTANEEDEKTIKELQRNAAFIDPARGAAHLVASQGDAMKMAASNPNAGPAMAFMGMNMAGQVGGTNAQTLYQMGQQQAAQAQQAPQATAPAAECWRCACGAENTGKFCVECGKPRPAAGWKCSRCGAMNEGKFCAECGSPKPADDSWTCACGAVNHGKFCAECGKPKPTGPAKCAGCGWEVPEGQHPKFCPECGKPFA